MPKVENDFPIRCEEGFGDLLRVIVEILRVHNMYDVLEGAMEHAYGLTILVNG